MYYNSYSVIIYLINTVASPWAAAGGAHGSRPPWTPARRPAPAPTCICMYIYIYIEREREIDR